MNSSEIILPSFELIITPQTLTCKKIHKNYTGELFPKQSWSSLILNLQKKMKKKTFLPTNRKFLRQNRIEIRVLHKKMHEKHTFTRQKIDIRANLGKNYIINFFSGFNDFLTLQTLKIGAAVSRLLVGHFSRVPDTSMNKISLFAKVCHQKIFFHFPERLKGDFFWISTYIK